MNILKKIISICFFISSAFVFSEEASIKDVFKKTLGNGLEIFVVENNAVPLAYIKLSVKTGAMSQTPETAGLFHLYEHVMFKGNAKYKNQKEFIDAENKLGVIDENGVTSTDYVQYYFTLPSSLVREGLEFWSYAIRTPKIDMKELENEKGVVLSEITNDFSNPSHIAFAAYSKNMFPESPFLLDAGGNPDIIKNATPEILRNIQKEFYVPNNSAIFVGGDVKHEEIFKYAEEIFGDWNQNPNIPKAKVCSKTPFSKNRKFVYPCPGTSDDFITVEYFLRGPDGETDENDTYAADVWSELSNIPDGVLKKLFMNNRKLAIPDSDYIYSLYSTKRISGRINFSATLLNDSNFTPVEKSDEYLSIIENDMVSAMKDKEFYSKIDFIVNKIQDNRIYETENAAGFVDVLAFFWNSCASSDYYFNYENRISSVTENDVKKFIDDYISDKYGMFIVYVSPDMYIQFKSEFEKSGYEEITAENSFWWVE